MALHLHQLKKDYTAPDGSVVRVIDIDSFRLGDGEQVALMGTSGSGKTTLLHLIAGILSADSGRIVFDLERNTGSPGTAAPAAGTGEAERPEDRVLEYRSAPAWDIAGMSEAGRDVFRGRFIGYIFQTHHLLPGFTALENVLLGMSFTGRRADRGWAVHLLEEVGLADRLHFKPEKLSVGQQQRVAVARALANRPRLVLADEPTGALDVRNAQQVLELIRRLCNEVNAALLLVTHDPQIAGQFPRTVSLAELNRVESGQGSGFRAQEIAATEL
jgi:putative ABC transport system ATP-binding protein